MKLIPLTQGKFATVDDEDFEFLNAFKWCAQKRGNGVFHAARYAGKKYVYMHQLVISASPSFEIHHMNGNGLDNRRANLRLVSRSEHRQSDVRLRQDNSSGYRGVWWHKEGRKWAAEITHKGCKYCLGLFTDEKAAAEARDTKARELGWPESGLNFPRIAA